MTDRANADSRLREQLLHALEGSYNPENLLDRLSELFDRYSQEIAREARYSTADYAIRLIEGGYRTDTDLGAQNYKRMMLDFAELTQKLAEEQTIDAKTQALINDNLFNLFEDKQ